MAMIGGDFEIRGATVSEADARAAQAVSTRCSRLLRDARHSAARGAHVHGRRGARRHRCDAHQRSHGAALLARRRCVGRARSRWGRVWRDRRRCRSNVTSSPTLQRDGPAVLYCRPSRSGCCRRCRPADSHADRARRRRPGGCDGRAARRGARARPRDRDTERVADRDGARRHVSRRRGSTWRC